MHEWFKDGVLIHGETQPFLYIPDALPSDRGNYSCRVTNSEGVITSTSTQLTINGVFLVIIRKVMSLQMGVGLTWFA